MRTSAGIVVVLAALGTALAVNRWGHGPRPLAAGDERSAGSPGTSGAESRQGDEESRTVSAAWALDGARELRASSNCGAVTFAPSESEEVRLKWTARAGGEQATAERFVREARVTWSREGDAYVVTSVWPWEQQPPELHRARVDLEITGPARLRVHLVCQNGAVEASGPAQARLETQNGAVCLRDCAGTAEVNTMNGAVTVERCGGALHASSQNGALKLSGCRGPVEASTQNGEVRVAGAQGPVDASAVNGPVQVDLEASTSAPDVRLETQTGEIRLTVPLTTSARVTADSQTGSVEIGTESERRDLGAHAERVLGAGDGHISLKTTLGAIRLVEEG
ncbi:MAG TPA: DUF4097 family beta strand repeat-containing protein [Armatimonadota bacterium]